MKIASIADVKAHFRAYVKASEEQPVVVTRNGKPVAMLLPIGDEEELERLMMAYSPRLQAILEAARRRIKSGKGIPEDEFWEQVEKENGARKRSGKRTKAI